MPDDQAHNPGSVNPGSVKPGSVKPGSVKPGKANPGDARARTAPGDRTLERPPGQRYAARVALPESRDRPNGLRSLGYGTAAALVATIIWALGDAVLELSALALAAVAGWLVGVGTNYGAWHSAKHPRWPMLAIMGAILGLATWLAGGFLGHLLSLLLIPESTSTLADRLAQAPYLDNVAAERGPVVALEIGLIVGLAAWLSSRGDRRVKAQ